MIDKIIMEQPLTVRETAVAKDGKIVIAANLNKNSVEQSLKEDLGGKEFNLSKVLIAGLQAKNKGLEPINTLLLKGGR